MDVVDLLKLHEGFRDKPYQCTAGKWTIGYGRNLDDFPLSEEEAEYLMLRPLRDAAADIQQNFSFARKLNEARVAAVVDMRYNLGYGGFRTFKRFILALTLEDYELASREMLDSLWAKQVGARATRLAEIIRTGEINEST